MYYLALNVIRIVVNEQRHFVKFDEPVMVRHIYGWHFSGQLTIGEKRRFGRIFYENCQTLGFRFIKKKNGVCTYQRIR